MGETYAVLENSGLVQGFTPSQIQRITALTREATFHPDELVISEINRSRDLYLLLSGRLSVSFTLPIEDQHREVINNIHPGEIFGELSFLDGSPRSASVSADEESNVLIFSSDKLRHLMEEDTSIGYHLLDNISRILAAKLRQTNLAWRNSMIW